ncbi:MAG: MotA/TolQ/ExbB proton channel family protein, partial [Verrucomicrobiota bacterium]
AKPGGESVFQVIWHGGWLIRLIWLAIIGTSVTMVTFVIQNMITLRIEKQAPKVLIKAIATEISAGNYQAAWQTCSANDNYLANVLRVGLERLGRGKEAAEDGIAEASLREAQIMRTRNSYLSVIGVVSPMIGLLGTVIGMMGAFATLGASGISDPRGLATSIGEVLMATASGLFIAIPAFIAYYVFRNRSQMVIVHADDQINNLIADIPYDELKGIRLGENFSPGTGTKAEGGTLSRKVSMALTTNCPICSGAVTPGVNPCPHCGTTLDWAQ